jgi:hypothetical protein
MTTIPEALRFVPALALLGCISDFSPDPIKGPQNKAVGYDGGSASLSPAPTGTTTLPGAGSAGSGTDAGSQGGASLGLHDAASTAPPAGGAACDLSGRWIMTERMQSSAFGAQQVNLNWYYLEIQQQGEALVITRSLACGNTTNNAPGDLFEVHMDDRRAWPSYQANTNYDGRKGSSRSSGSGCEASFEQSAAIRGMTVDYYEDPSRPLPTLEQRESGATPGWADWDNDGNPGVTLVVTGTASGTLYTAMRTVVTSLSGTFAPGAQLIKLDNMNWKVDRVVLATKEPDPLNILASPAERNPGAGLNFAELARLGVDQATGGDDAICAAIRELAPALNPAANAS